MIFCNVDQEIIIDENTSMGEYIVIFFLSHGNLI